MKEIEQLVRKNIIALKAYSSARDEFKGETLSSNHTIFIDANENPLGSVGFAQSYNRYPDPTQRSLKDEIAKLKNTKADTIFLGNGSDEAIDLLIRIFCEPQKDTILITPPTYGMYEVAANINDVGIERVLLRESDFGISAENILAKITPHTKLIFLCSPNNPTGNLLKRDDIVRILQTFTGIVVIDEAYIDFAETPSWIATLQHYPRLVVLQTFSKAWGLAGLRLGMAFAHPMIIQLINKVKPPYNINQATQEIALTVLKQKNDYQKHLQTLIAERVKLYDNLTRMPLFEKVFPSEANFVLVRPKTDAQQLYDYLISQSIIVRNRSSQPLCQNTLRLSVGSPAENELLIEKLRQFSI
ncbi:MAG: histidinol-phosphate transaminase [Cytophagales bacterium]|nr:MAG: histidinol-phosphate transaminase [Cytophagales bacterium]